MTITDEMMDKFEPVFLAKGLRPALEAVAPMIAAQTMREDVMELMNRAEGDMDLAEFLIKARAQELDPQ